MVLLCCVSDPVKNQTIRSARLPRSTKEIPHITFKFLIHFCRDLARWRIDPPPITPGRRTPYLSHLNTALSINNFSPIFSRLLELRFINQDVITFVDWGAAASKRKAAVCEPAILGDLVREDVLHDLVAELRVHLFEGQSGCPVWEGARVSNCSEMVAQGVGMNR